MSKQTPPRSNLDRIAPTGAKPTPRPDRPQKNPNRPQPPTPKGNRPANTAVRPPGMSAQQRVQAQQAAARQKKSGGWKLRPLDIALLGVGVIVVAFVVWSIQSGSNQTPTASQPGGPTAESTPLPVGATAPNFSLPGVDGKTYNLSDNRGKVTVLEFFAPWCPHCQDDAPMFNSVAERFAAQDVQMLAVSASPRGRDNKTPIEMGDLTWFRDEFKVSFPMLLDKEMTYSEAYSIMFYPTVYVVDKEGKIAAQPTGAYTWQNGEPVSDRRESLTEAELGAAIENALK